MTTRAAGLSNSLNGLYLSVSSMKQDIAKVSNTVSNMGTSITTEAFTCSSLSNSGTLRNNGDLSVNEKFNVDANTGNTVVTGTLTGGISTLGATSVTGLTNTGTLRNTGNATFSGIISVTGSAAVGSLISNNTAMVRQPYMPYDEVTVEFDGTETASIIMQTNYLAGSYAVTVVKNSTGNYTFTFTPSNHGTKTFDYAYMIGLSPTTTAATYTHAPTTSLITTVITYNANVFSNADIAGHYMFRLRSSNQSNST